MIDYAANACVFISTALLASALVIPIVELSYKNPGFEALSSIV